MWRSALSPAAAVALALAAACGRVGYDALSGPEDGGPDSAGGADAPPLGPFGPPMPVGPLNTLGSEDDATLTGDMLEIFFDRDSDIFTAKRTSVGDTWGTPTAITILNSPDRETAPEVSVDGLVLWFASSRPGGSGAEDIYVASRPDRASAWSTPARVPELCSSSKDNDSAPVADLLAMVLTSDRAGGAGDADLYFTTRASLAAAWAQPVLLGGVNTLYFDSNPWMDATRTVLYFATDRPGGAGAWGLWRAVRPDPGSAFTPAVPVAELNTSGPESDPWLSPDLRTIYFTSLRGGSADIYMATR